MRHLYVAAGTAARRAVADRSGLVVAVPFYAMVVAVLAGLWRAAVDGNGGEVAGYTALAITWYVAAAEACTVALELRLIDEIGRDVGSGAVATELLRPVSVVGVRVAAAFGKALPRLAVCMATAAVLVTATAGGPPRLSAMGLAIPSCALAVACNVVAQHAFAAAAFWLRDAGAAWFLYQKLVFILGGMLIPLEALPGWLESVAAVLPFRAMSYIPARLASGHFEPMLLLEQVGWLVVLGTLAAAAFHSGERRLQVVGG